MPNSITTPQNTSKITNIYQHYNLLFIMTSSILTIDIELEIKIIQDEEIGKNNTNFLAILFFSKSSFNHHGIMLELCFLSNYVLPSL